MNAVFLLMGLLVLSYLGSFLMSRRAGGAAGLPSGVEFAVLGYLLGPHLLGVVGARDLTTFEPVVQVAIGWLAFAEGMSFGSVDDRRIRGSSLVLGTFGALLTGAAAAAAVWPVIALTLPSLSRVDRIVLSGGVGAACSETTRHAVRWVAERSRARGPLATRLNELAHADGLVPLVAVAVIFALEPTQTMAARIPWREWPAVTVGLGLLLGGGAALLLRSEMPIEDTWGVLFGVSLLTVGTAARLGLCSLTATFFMGMAVSALSRHGGELRAMVAPTERPVLLPALLLAGARVDLATPALGWIAAAAIGARLASKLVVGGCMAATSKAARRGGPLVGWSLASSGALSMCIGLAFALRLPNVVGDTILAVAVVSAVVGEFVGPPRMKRALESARETDEGAPHGTGAGRAPA